MLNELPVPLDLHACSSLCLNPPSLLSSVVFSPVVNSGRMCYILKTRKEVCWELQDLLLFQHVSPSVLLLAHQPDVPLEKQPLVCVAHHCILHIQHNS